MARDAPPPPPPSIIFERQILPQQIIYRWKGNLTAGRIHFKYWKNILISRFYEQFSRNGSAMAPEKNFKLLKYEHIINLNFFRTAILEQLRSHFAKIDHKVAKSKYFSNIQNESYSLLNSLSNDI